MAGVDQNWLSKGLEKKESLMKIKFDKIQEDKCENILELRNYSQIGSYNWSEKERVK